MLNSDTYKKLQNKISSKSVQVGHVSASFILQANKETKTRAEFLKLISQRNIPNTVITQLNINNNIFFVIEQTIHPDEKTIMVVRIEVYGNNLFVNLHHFEIYKKSIKTLLIGNILLWGGIIFFWTGIGIVAAFYGWTVLTKKFRFPNGTVEQQSSLQYKQIITEILITALKNCEVDIDAQLFKLTGFASEKQQSFESP